MTKDVNKLRNSVFRSGRQAPASWEWEATGLARWERPTVGVAIICESGAKRAQFTQTVRCRRNQFYRIEATVQCSLLADDREGGFFLAVQPDDSAEPGRRSPFIHHAPAPLLVRTYYHTGEATRSLQISVGIMRAVGRAVVTSVALIPILEPDELSHPMAVPPPARTYAAPRVARNVCVCSGTAVGRRLTELLGAFFGPAHVRTQTTVNFRKAEAGDAVFLPDPLLPRALRSVSKLKELAKNQIVVVSLPAFAKIAGRALAMHCMEQPDDPIHAEVTYANHATVGFALHDAFAYAWAGNRPGSFRQNQFRKTEQFTRFCKRHHFAAFLASMCDRDKTSHQPVALYHRTDRGGLYVLDIDPLEVDASSMNEPVLAMHLVLNILGHGSTQLGQFVSPLRKEVHFRDMIREFAGRIEHVKVHDVDAPSAEVTDQLVTIGQEDQSYGLPLRPKPLILIRSGLVSGDFESIYGAWLWLKQLIRPAPHACPYAAALASCFRIAWIPCAAPWESGDGWVRLAIPPRMPISLEAEDCKIAAMIDLVSQPVNQVRVIAAQADSVHRQHAKWLPRLFAAFAPTDTFGYWPESGANFSDRRSFSWREWAPPLACEVDADSFDEEVHREVQAAGGSLLRVEIPGDSTDFVAVSIARTDLAATVLEHVIGLQYGLIAVNRRTGAANFDGFAPLASGAALIVPGNDPVLQIEASQAV